MARYSRSTSTVVLASGASGTSTPIGCAGAKRVHFSITCDVAHLLTTGNIVVRMSDGRTVTLTPLAFPDGSADVATHELDAAGVITGVALNAGHIGTALRPASGTIGPYNAGVLTGADYAHLALTKAATATDATYTIVATAYYD